MAAFRRTGRKTYEFQAVQADGRFTQTSTGTRNKPLATAIEAMWERLARRHRAWDLLDRVGHGLTIGQLYDLWDDTKQDVEEMRRRLDDRNIEPEVAIWHARYAADYPDAAERARQHVRWLLPEGRACPVSTVTPAWLSERLYAYRDAEGEPVKRNTRRKIHAHWSLFFVHCTHAGFFPASPMLPVPCPPLESKPPRFHDEATAKRIVDAQPDAMRKCLMALAYGGAIEASPLVKLTRRAVDLRTHEVIPYGTKTLTRHRVCRIAAWAWPYVHRYVKGLLPDAPLFPGLNRSTPSHWHLATERELGLPELTFHEARHHWAVRMIRAGTPIAVVQQQLGHGSPDVTMKVYAAFIPDGADRAAWDAKASKESGRVVGAIVPIVGTVEKGDTPDAP
jgi:integrase